MAGKTNKYGWMAFSAACLCIIMWVGIAWDTFSLFAGPVVEDLSISRTDFMLTLSIMTGVNAIGALFLYGPVEAKLGMRKTLGLAGICGTIAFALWTFMSNIAMLYLGGFIFAFCVAFSSNCATNSIVTYWFSKNRGQYVSISNMTGKITGVIAASVVAASIAGLGWRETFGICTAISALCTVLVILLYKGSPEQLGVKPIGATGTIEEAEQAEETGITRNQMLKSPKLYLVLIALLIGSMCGYAAFGTLPLFCIDFGFEANSGTIVSAGLLGAVIMMVPIGKICDKLGSRFGVAFCMICSVIGFVLLMQESMPIWVMYVIAFLLGAGNQLTNIVPAIAVTDAFGTKEYSKKIGIIQASTYAGVAAASPFLSMFYEGMGSYFVGLLALCALAAVSVVLSFFVLRRGKHSN